MHETLQTKVKETDLTQVECCNTCLSGEREYNRDINYPTGIKCLKGEDNEGRFDYLCPTSYKPDTEFIERNKDLGELIEG